MTTVRKTLSANDLGLTGSHQAGMLVPKDKHILSFFPSLNRTTKNPRANLVLREVGDGARREFNFIYYNGKLFGGTRNEYRLTCMTAYLRECGARVGDEIVLSRNQDGSYLIDLIRSNSEAFSNTDETIVLSGGWKIIK
ncbi:EcoRII N-terminal effector-binding domain-containing protein [Stenotrophomonas maltophilia]|uniref:EcoRII N-terminal effector-binding domain-containing protein n=1 Tax=Stenotrophomonas maltophilia TaxID=40324 RepID=UPI0034DAF959